MMDRRIDEAMTGRGDNEFVPPLDLPETWGPAWERQLDAALAWQAAAAAAEGSTASRERAPVRTRA